MNFESLLSVLMGTDVHWMADGSNLRVDAPRGILSPDLRDSIQNHKTVLLDVACRRTPTGWTRHSWADHLKIIAIKFECRAAMRARELRELASWHSNTDPMQLPPEWRVEWEERAAIREIDGHQAREHAEAEALREVLDRMKREQ